MRLVMELKSDMADDNLKHLCIVKGNYLPATEKNESYNLRFTDNMTFINTGGRTPIESLAKVIDDKKQKYELIKEYQSQGYTTSEIAPKIGYKSKGSVSKIVKMYESNNAVSEMFPIETTETVEETKRQIIQYEAFPSPEMTIL